MGCVPLAQPYWWPMDRLFKSARGGPGDDGKKAQGHSIDRRSLDGWWVGWLIPSFLEPIKEINLQRDAVRWKNFRHATLRLGGETSAIRWQAKGGDSGAWRRLVLALSHVRQSIELQGLSSSSASVRAKLMVPVRRLCRGAIPHTVDKAFNCASAIRRLLVNAACAGLRPALMCLCVQRTPAVKSTHAWVLPSNLV